MSVRDEEQRIAGLSDAALAAEVKRFTLLNELSAENKAYGDALMHEVMRRFNERRVWLGPGIVFAPDGIYDGPQTTSHKVD
jgi:hypothetical protein